MLTCFNRQNVTKTVKVYFFFNPVNLSFIKRLNFKIIFFKRIAFRIYTFRKLKASFIEQNIVSLSFDNFVVYVVFYFL